MEPASGYLEKLKAAETLCPNYYPNFDATVAYHRQFPANDPGAERSYLACCLRLVNALPRYNIGVQLTTTVELVRTRRVLTVLIKS
ncbi:hypothetical protein ACJ72_06265 [Emergomyces africanus]|uniref:Uncharacterized protein n=1 Tax=Emergomyces africanus TaxID=1955775 RepID=A0A1B7NRR4_9EURO|nr:hypothetical protein ACJ72_06265 [Emergomyces africanus]